MLYWFAMNQCQNNAINCLNIYQMQDLIYIESMFVICPIDIITFHTIVLMLWQWVPFFKQFNVLILCDMQQHWKSTFMKVVTTSIQ